MLLLSGGVALYFLDSNCDPQLLLRNFFLFFLFALCQVDSFSKSIAKTEDLLSSFRVQAAAAPLFALALGTGRESGAFLKPLRKKLNKLHRKRTYW